jgi:hypothetical protein
MVNAFGYNAGWGQSGRPLVAFGIGLAEDVINFWVFGSVNNIYPPDFGIISFTNPTVF